MSLLTFLGLRQPKYNRAPLTLADILHRTFVTGLAGLSIYGIYLGYSVHDHVMTKGKEALAQKEAEVRVREEVAEEAREQSLAEAAQAALPKRS